jgi:hypothetical protein
VFAIVFANVLLTNYHILKAVICAGLYPNVIVVDKSKSTPKLATRSGEVFLHPACLDAGQAELLFFFFWTRDRQNFFFFSGRGTGRTSQNVSAKET